MYAVMLIADQWASIDKRMRIIKEKIQSYVLSIMLLLHSQSRLLAGPIRGGVPQTLYAFVWLRGHKL